jgi:hypothetical protein
MQLIRLYQELHGLFFSVVAVLFDSRPCFRGLQNEKWFHYPVRGLFLMNVQIQNSETLLLRY